MTPADALMNTVQWRETGLADDGSGAPFATHEGVLSIGGIDLNCYQLSTGQRVFDAESVARFFAPPDKCIHCDSSFVPRGPDEWCYCRCHHTDGF